MKNRIFTTLMSMLLLTGVAFGRINVSVVLVPPLPVVVELDAGNHYYQNGYYYYHRGDVWQYSKYRHGPWRHLPRDRYPREVRYKNHDHGERGYGHDNRHHDRNWR